MRFLVAPDSFKGTMPPSIASAAMKAGILGAFPRAEVTCLPLADGGDGTLDALSHSIQLDRIQVIARNARGFAVQAEIGRLPGKTAIIETAQANGLSLLPKSLQDPMLTSSQGVGDLIKAAVSGGAEKIILTLGGSATVEGGSGMAVSLGWQHIAIDGQELKGTGAELIRLSTIRPPRHALDITHCEAWVDVQTPMLGPSGAVDLFAPQKGARAEDMPILEQGLAQLAKCWKSDLARNVGRLPGGGAAGGLGAGVHVYLGAELISGASALFDLIGLDQHLRQVDFVVTGEGCLDVTSLEGKLIGNLLNRASLLKVPVLTVAGQFGSDAGRMKEFKERFLSSMSVSDYCGLKTAMEHPEKSLALTTRELVKNLGGS